MHGVEFFLILLVGAPLGAAIWLGATVWLRATVWPGRRAMSPGRLGADKKLRSHMAHRMRIRASQICAHPFEVSRRYAIGNMSAMRS
jgi:hypothetical protein